MDVHNAFLHGNLAEEVYLLIPLGFEKGRAGQVCRLHYSLFTYFHQGIRLNVLVYLDDLIISENDTKQLQKFKQYLSTCFKMKDLETGLLGAKPAAFSCGKTTLFGLHSTKRMFFGARFVSVFASTEGRSLGSCIEGGSLSEGVPGAGCFAA
ncbi:hypothetical protein LIER_16667 [Lithospermum erythrorhizon]|uniref:Reverse transcriptase n=1 Tax=Lithospermum erythrorhizon TaxID=34254 RepID=A0AAV3Q7J5_LITER